MNRFKKYNKKVCANSSDDNDNIAEEVENEVKKLSLKYSDEVSALGIGLGLYAAMAWLGIPYRGTLTIAAGSGLYIFYKRSGYNPIRNGTNYPQ